MKKLLRDILIVVSIIFVVTLVVVCENRNSKHHQKTSFENMFHVQYPSTDEKRLLAISSVQRSLDEMKETIDVLGKEVTTQFDEIRSFPKIDIEDYRESEQQLDLVRKYLSKAKRLEALIVQYHEAIDIAYRAGFHNEAVAHGYSTGGGGFL